MDHSQNIRREEEGGSGRYVLPLDATHSAELTFSRPDAGTMLVTHTFVPPAFEGRGVGRVLVERAVEDARAEGVRITPLCGYVAALFRRKPDWAGVLKAR